MSVKDRSRLSFKFVYAARHPQRIVPYARRLSRDTWLSLRSQDHVSYHRAVMKSDAARSVFSHSPIGVIEECLAHVGRVMAPGGFFDFTFDRTEGAEHQVLREDFYYRTETLVALAERNGLAARFMADWEKSPHEQSKLRVTKPGRWPGSPSAG